ncbi:hypothetical protein [Hoeflea poritis]|uniref:Uncharacterized protein n=1 Tax=Hoeflea poritis TaxID=2993659 RepID=A0ABT4VP78_9HYPH|nr:hypothetical protein [Hoeflea poritis]MDA4845940.1 hypothetical protein [Hoeflea poritis]
MKLDLDDYHTKRELSEFTLIFTWLHTQDGPEECLVLTRSGEETNDHTVPAIVFQRHAYIFAPETGDPRAAARACFQLCEALRINPYEVKNILRIQALIDDHLDDLLHIPPFSRRKPGNLIAEVTITDHSTGKTTEVEIDDDV